MRRRQMWTSAGHETKMAGSKTDPPYKTQGDGGCLRVSTTLILDGKPCAVFLVGARSPFGYHPAKKSRRCFMFFGVLLLILGGLMLLNQFGLLRGDTWDYFWPVVVIAIGVSMIFKQKQVKKP